MSENHERQPPLWAPGDARKRASHLQAFVRHPAVREHLPEDVDYAQLHRWSCAQPAAFWAAVQAYCGVQFSTPPSTVFAPGEHFRSARWFPGATLNFAEQLLARPGPGPAIIAHREGGPRQVLGWQDLEAQVAALAAFFREQGVQPGDRVAAIMPNVADTVVTMLAAVSVGAVWSSCSPDFGAAGILDRFAQIEPRWLIACDGYVYNGKRCETLALAAQVAARIPSLQGVLLSEVLEAAADSPAAASGADSGTGSAARFTVTVHRLRAVLAAHRGALPAYLPQPFDHPLVIAYSSGTTGLPKAIVHRAGGVLLQHLKEHQLQVDIHPGDRFFYFSTCGWMMWNWLVSGLGSGATLVLYDGSPFAAEGQVLLDLIDSEQIAVFGVGAKYLQSLQKQGIHPRQGRSLSSLRTVLSTGSPLSEESFDFVYREFKAELHLASISGGTDLLSCFVGGVPTLPVRRGRIQAAGLGMDVQVWNAQGQRVVGERGELVCVQPFPTVPLGFWNDPEDARFFDSYFSVFPEVWCQSDFSEQDEDGSFQIFGRSDAVLNPGGVRIGTAEIYRQLERVPAVLDAVVIGQPWEDDVRVVLFVVLADGHALDEALSQHIRSTLREGASPRHVPAVMLPVPDVPRTLSGKIAEKAVLQTVMGESVGNRDALANPRALEAFAALREQLQ